MFYDSSFYQNMDGDAHHQIQKKEVPVKGHVFKLEFMNANTEVLSKGFEPEKTYENFYIGNDEKHWASHVLSYKQVKYNNLYPSVDTCPAFSSL